MFRKNSFRAGFSLLELMVYVTILSVVLVVMGVMFGQFLMLKAEAEISEGFYKDASRILTDFVSAGNESGSIDDPVPGGSGAGLVLDGGTVVYELSGGSLLKNGSRLNSNLTKVENLIYKNLTDSPDSTPSVSLEFELVSETLAGSENEERRVFKTAVNLW